MVEVIGGIGTDGMWRNKFAWQFVAGRSLPRAVLPRRHPEVPDLDGSAESRPVLVRPRSLFTQTANYRRVFSRHMIGGCSNRISGFIVQSQEHNAPRRVSGFVVRVRGSNVALYHSLDLTIL